MKVLIKKELNHSYFVVREKEEKMQKDCLMMVTENRIEGFLPMEVRRMDDCLDLYYEISGCRSMRATFRDKAMSGEDVCFVLEQIATMMERAEEYLLDKAGILLHQEVLFYRGNTMQFCYLPALRQDPEKSFDELLDWVLKHIDYEDEATVRLLYELKSKTMKEGVGLRRILQSLEQSRTNWEKEEGQIEKRALLETPMEEEPENSGARAKMLLMLPLILFAVGFGMALRFVRPDQRLQMVVGAVLAVVLVTYFVTKQGHRLLRMRDRLHKMRGEKPARAMWDEA